MIDASLYYRVYKGHKKGSSINIKCPVCNKIQTRKEMFEHEEAKQEVEQ